ncbi:MAG: carbohydrate kinase family protein [Sphaerochaetaceae bacterium]|nr:carbohydrate kinase family protein [Sphaerochaetaceae bacterium]
MNIVGTGCCLVDSIYMNVAYADEAFSTLWSKSGGDGGLIEGGLVFREDLEHFAGKSYPEILWSITKGRYPDTVNLGGPAIIALVHAAQILVAEDARVSFYGAVGSDDNCEIICSKLSQTPVDAYLKDVEGLATSTTDVFDDPSKRDGRGERSFVNTIGAAGEFEPSDLPDSFFKSDIVLLGGTALVPRIHDDLSTILSKVKMHGGITVVGTVFDFRNEKSHPDQIWPLGDQGSYRNIDLLVTDQEEALHFTGVEDIMDAAKILISYGVGALIITRGASDILVWSGGSFIEPYELTALPVNAYIDALLEKDSALRKDTTGCGDNFVGGVLVSLYRQLSSGRKHHLDLLDIVAWGASSGGFTCMYHGGMYHESMKGEKLARLIPAVKVYTEQWEQWK